ncbi:MAG: V4R domain-containing protein [Promethearchaeota archaeon]
MSSVASREPVRVTLFTSVDCKFCPAVDRIVRRVVGSGFGSTIYVKTVDVDLSPQVATQFNIRTLPTVVIDQEPVLVGYMSEDDIKDRLWNKLFESILAKDVAYGKRKENMLYITKKTIDSVQNKDLSRSLIGDYCHLETLQMCNLSILALDRMAGPLLYQAGKDVGKYGAGQMLLLNLNPRIAAEFRIGPRFHEIMRGLQRVYSDHTRFPTWVSDNAELINLKSDSAILRIYGSAYGVQAPKIGEPLCHTLAGEIAGQIEVLLGRFARVRETSCWGLGDEYCEFLIETSEEEEKMAVTSDEGKKEASDRRELFLTSIYEMSSNLQESLKFKRTFRSVGDFVHISIVQQALTGLKFMDPFCGTLLYSAGSEYGMTGPGKEIIQTLIYDNRLTTPLEFEKAVSLIGENLKHPTFLLPRNHSLTSWEIEDDETAFININECTTASGTPDLGMTFCDFMAGFISGRLQLLIRDDAIVKEIECHGTGHKHCKFEITLD